MYINYSVQWFNDLICGLKGLLSFISFVKLLFKYLIKNDIAVGWIQIRLNEILVACRRRGVWVIRKRWPRSEAVTPIINIYIGAGVNVVGSTR